MTDIAAPAGARRKKAHPGTTENTETEFLDAAERQFAEHGYAGAKIRAIADEAHANLGALHYYWGSKESLFRAACGRRMAPMIEERLARFDALGEQASSVEAILRAYFEPAFLSNRESPVRRKLFCQIYARILTDPSPEVKSIMVEIFAEPTRRFVQLLRGACPHVDDRHFYWRLHCVFGASQHAATYTDDIGLMAEGRFDTSDLEFGIETIIQFVATGISAPMP
ncbi:TetR/AcrR family transcriptional regulator [Rhizobium sp.]